MMSLRMRPPVTSLGCEGITPLRISNARKGRRLARDRETEDNDPRLEAASSATIHNGQQLHGTLAPGTADRRLSGIDGRVSPLSRADAFHARRFQAGLPAR